MTRFLLLLIFTAVTGKVLIAQTVNLQVQVVELERKVYTDCVGCGNPDPVWKYSGDHNGGSAGEFSFCEYYNGSSATTKSVSHYIINATNISATNFKVVLNDAYEKNCNSDWCTYYDYYFFDCFSVYGDSRRQNGNVTINFLS